MVEGVLAGAVVTSPLRLVLQLAQELRSTIQIAGVAGFVGLAAVQYFAHGDRSAPEATRMAQASTVRSALDPETTGSIVKGARLVRLDPCSLPSGTHGLRP